MNNNEVTIADIDIPFGRWVLISLKIWFATLIAGLVLAIPIAIIWSVPFFIAFN